jgi:hypothetical protein
MMISGVLLLSVASILIVKLATKFERGFKAITDEVITRHLSDPESYHRKITAKYFKLPNSAVFTEFDGKAVWVEWSYEVRFRLPPSHSPRRWLILMAKENHFKDRSICESSVGAWIQGDRMRQLRHIADTGEFVAMIHSK